MFESETPEVYEKVYGELLGDLAGADLPGAAGRLGLDWDAGQKAVPVTCLGRDYLAGAGGVRAKDGGTASFMHRIVLAWLLLRRGAGETSGRFVPYRALPGGQDFARALSDIVEGRLARSFGGKLALLKKAAEELGMEPPEEDVSGDLYGVFRALPRVPLLLTFYDEDEEFPAEAKVFFDLTAPNFLDLECLAVLALMLVMELESRAGIGG